MDRLEAGRQSDRGYSSASNVEINRRPVDTFGGPDHALGASVRKGKKNQLKNNEQGGGDVITTRVQVHPGVTWRTVEVLMR